MKPLRRASTSSFAPGLAYRLCAGRGKRGAGLCAGSRRWRTCNPLHACSGGPADGGARARLGAAPHSNRDCLALAQQVQAGALAHVARACGRGGSAAHVCMLRRCRRPQPPGKAQSAAAKLGACNIAAAGRTAAAAAAGQAGCCVAGPPSAPCSSSHWRWKGAVKLARSVSRRQSTPGNSAEKPSASVAKASQACGEGWQGGGCVPGRAGREGVLLQLVLRETPAALAVAALPLQQPWPCAPRMTGCRAGGSRRPGGARPPAQPSCAGGRGSGRPGGARARRGAAARASRPGGAPRHPWG